MAKKPDENTPVPPKSGHPPLAGPVEVQAAKKPDALPPFKRKAQGLIALAGDTGFTDLTRAEQTLLHATAIGEWAACESFEDAERAVRSSLFEWLILHDEPRPFIHPKGVQIFGVIFQRNVDLQRANFDSELWMHRCRFEGELIIRRASLSALSLASSTCVRGLDAEAASIGGDIFLRNGFESLGEVDLRGAEIGGQLSCVGGKFLHKSGQALNADGAMIGGSVFLRDGFESLGEVNLRGAKIGGQLSCVGGKFLHKSGRALNADAATIGGAVFLRDGFESSGEVSLVGAKISGQLDCTNGKFRHKSGRALDADAATIGGDVFIRIGFESSGEVNLNSITVTGALQCQGAKFTTGPASGLDALDLTNAKIGRFLSFVDHWTAANPAKFFGRVLLRHCQCDQFDDAPEVWGLTGAESNEPEQPIELSLDGLTYTSLGNHRQSLDKTFRTDWLRKGTAETERPFSPQPYNQLAKVLHGSGHEELAREILIERNRRLYKEVEKPAADTPWKKLILALRWLVVCQLLVYGYRTRRAGVALVGMWLFGAVMFWGGWAAGSFNPALPHIYNSWIEQVDQVTGEPVIAMDDPQRRHAYVQRYGGSYKKLASEKLPEYPGFMSLVYSADTLLPIVNLHQEPYWEPTGWTRVYLWLHILGGWLFTTLAVVGFTGIVRRE